MQNNQIVSFQKRLFLVALSCSSIEKWFEFLEMKFGPLNKQFFGGYIYWREPLTSQEQVNQINWTHKIYYLVMWLMRL